MNQSKKERKKQGKRRRGKNTELVCSTQQHQGLVGVVGSWGEVKKLGSIQGVLP
jgi:hypothetical protein